MENNWWREQGIYMETKARESQTKNFYQALKSTYGPQRSKFMPQMIKEADGSMLSKPKQVRERWKQYFDRLLNQQVSPSVDLDKFIEDRLICWEINVPPTMEELDKAIKSFSNHKMTGDDGMVTETLKYAESESAKSKLLKLFAITWNTGHLP